MQKITISHMEAGRRLDNYLIRALPGGGLSFIHKMLRKKNITVNGRKCEGNYRLAEGDEICMFFSDETYEKMRDPGHAVNITSNIDEYRHAYKKLTGIEVVYEDNDFIFIDKPSGVLSQKASVTDISVNEWLTGYLLDKGEVSEESLKTYKPAFANRLDRNTSGLMLGARSLAASQFLSKMLRDRNMHKYYLCMAEGHPDDSLPVNEDEYIDIYGYLVKDRDRNTVKVYSDKLQAVKYAESCEPVAHKQTGYAEDNRVSEIHTGFRLLRLTEDGRMILEVELHTGKSHQIRAQLSALGHPISGDPKYGSGRKDRSGFGGVRKGDNDPGQCLHAYRVVFPELPEWPALSGREFCSAKTLF